MTLRSLPERIWASLRKERLDQELDDEIESHLEMAVEENIRRGMEPAEARRAARREFGGLEQMKEQYRDLGRLRWVEAALQDLRYAARRLRRSPGFTAAAVLILALGLGANTAIFSVIDAVLLRPLPFPEPNRLVGVWEETPMFGLKYSPAAMGNYVEWRDQNHVFQEMGALEQWQFRLTGDGRPEEVMGSYVTAGLFHVLGAKPLLGRTFAQGEDLPGAPKTVVLSYGLWQRRCAGNTDIVGTRIRINEEPYMVIGVMADGFRFPSSDTGLWAPLGALLPVEEWTNKGRHNLMTVARLAPGVTVRQADDDIRSIAARLSRDYPQTNAGVGAFVAPLQDYYVSSQRPLYAILLGTVILVLLIACANLANLLLTRAAHGQRETAVRSALGASSWDLARQGLAESILLSLAGGAIGLAVAELTFGFLGHLVPAQIAASAPLSLDYRVLVFTLAVSIATALLCGAAPILQSLRIDVNHTLRQGGSRAGTGRTTHRLRAALVISQVALSLVLLIGAVLLIRTFESLRSVDPGFQPENVVTMRVPPASAMYQDSQRRMIFYRDVLERIESLPGVLSAGFTTGVPLAFKGWQNVVSAEGTPVTNQGDQPMANFRLVTPDYRKTMGIPLLRGRDIRESDGPDARPVAMVNQAMARMLWPGQDALGKRFRNGGWPMEGKPWITVVGIVSDIKQTGLDKPARPEMYIPEQQSANLPPVLAVRTRGASAGIVDAIREQIRSVDPDQPIADVETMEQVLDREVFERRLQTILLSAFAGLALLVSAFGVYGVVSYIVEQSRHEIGVRMALGARPVEAIRHVLGSGLRMVAGGVATGLIVALAVTRFLSHVLFGIGPRDVATFAAVSVVLVVVGALAVLIPAARATRVNPITALREE